MSVCLNASHRQVQPCLDSSVSTVPNGSCLLKMCILRTSHCRQVGRGKLWSIPGALHSKQRWSLPTVPSHTPNPNRVFTIKPVSERQEKVNKNAWERKLFKIQELQKIIELSKGVSGSPDQHWVLSLQKEHPSMNSVLAWAREQSLVPRDSVCKWVWGGSNIPN